ncbi:carbohydrate-binding domain-containing protein C2E1P3.05c-like [Portunus trituberculatus]|uniref:carbohydrate-binding domain-containing protein C2E1P3.05c-like n=1 Tax=Portunus trituberculatus TaxID=210409 RepID=UPI001E1D12C6|nr:carbohydrate-binding domain-containing protein C2E1P3.05c-like [Portunus trituberculatus]
MGWASLALGLLVLISASYQQAAGKTCKEAGGQCLGDRRAQICSQYLDSSLSCDEGKVCCTRKGPASSSDLLDSLKDEDNTIKEVCRSGKKCKKAHGVCQSMYEKCKGKTLKKGCKDHGCVCCVPKLEPKCKTKKPCKKKKGVCQSKKEHCKGKISKKGCKGKGCVCCYNKKTTPVTSTTTTTGPDITTTSTISSTTTVSSTTVSSTTVSSTTTTVSSTTVSSTTTTVSSTTTTDG